MFSRSHCTYAILALLGLTAACGASGGDAPGGGDLETGGSGGVGGLDTGGAAGTAGVSGSASGGAGGAGGTGGVGGAGGQAGTTQACDYTPTAIAAQKQLKFNEIALPGVTTTPAGKTDGGRNGLIQMKFLPGTTNEFFLAQKGG